MTSPAPASPSEIAPAAAVASPSSVAAPKPAWWRRAAYQVYRTVLGLWKFTVGVALIQNPLPSLLAAGWVQRAAQRAIALHWWKASALPKDACFCDFVQCSAFHRGAGGWPNWVLEQDRVWMRVHRTTGPGKFRAIARSLLHSLWLNLKVGVQTVFNTAVFVLPASVLMLFAWYDGWHNSFNKGYEQALVGPVTGFAGIFLFIAAMFYVPMAQMRQASTGDWRAFYQFRTVWELIRKRWIGCFGLALLYVLLALPFTLLKTAPAFFPQISPALAELPPDRAFAFARNYYFFSGFAFFAILLVLRLAAARLYAGTLLAGLQSGAVPEEALAEREWELLHRLDLLTVRPQPRRHFLVRTVTWFGTKLGRATLGIGIFLAWFAFISQVYISEFILKSPGGRGWINQPLVLLPWFNWIPPQLRQAAQEPPDAAAAEEWQGRRF